MCVLVNAGLYSVVFYLGEFLKILKLHFELKSGS